MKFLVDAQLPRRLAVELRALGADAIHTLDLPEANRTTDSEVIAIADRDGRVIVTKDSDFVDRHLLHAEPARLLLISTGNIGNEELIRLIRGNWAVMEAHFRQGVFVELDRANITLHG